jgi:protein-S-isoprenylcysteine O-methyltransferase Ste14
MISRRLDGGDRLTAMRGRAGPIVGSALFLVIAPGTVAGIVPYLLTGWCWQPPFLGWVGTRALGALLAALGVAVLVHSFALFALRGRGTPAPVLPTEHLVVSGWYRVVRNPMYVAMLCVVVGQALLFGSRMLLGYAGLLWAAFHAFVLAYEEPTLRKRYGAEYEAYCAAVGRWWPRPYSARKA